VIETATTIGSDLRKSGKKKAKPSSSNRRR
jgi:hypothetical protein